MTFIALFRRSAISLVLFGLLSGCAGLSSRDDVAAFEARVKVNMPEVEYSSVRKVPDSPFWELTIEGTQLLYVTDDARFGFDGQLVDFKNHRFIRQDRAEEIIRNEIAKVDEKYMLVYGPADAKRTLTVFIDLDCEYCERFVHDLPELTSAGVRFRILFAPRGEVNSYEFRRAVALWCSPDPKGHLAEAFRHSRVLPDKDVCMSPVFASHELARTLGIGRTPAFVDENGRVVFGYLGMKKLVKTFHLPRPIVFTQQNPTATATERALGLGRPTPTP